MRAVVFVMVLGLVLVAGIAGAQLPKWCQYPGEDPALQSQFDMCGNWTGEAADDFLCEDGSEITTVEWWGIHVPPECGMPVSFIIRFYSDIPDPDPGNPDTWSQPGDLLYEEECLYFTEVWDDQYQQYRYAQELPVPFQQEIGTVYWISIQAVVCAPAQGWAWCECDDYYYWNDEAVWRSQNPDPQWFFPNWTPPSIYTGGVYYMELAFCLWSDIGTPVEESTWGSIKGLYR